MGGRALGRLCRPPQGSPNEKLNVAFVGAGGRGPSLDRRPGRARQHAWPSARSTRPTPAATFKAYPKVPRYTDYRKMFDELERKIDAVVVATPDHHHYPASMMALQRGKHVYCEKPLTYTIEQARLLAKVAREKKLATQMGNQGNSSDSTRLIREWIKAGVLGEVREIHHWNDYPMAAREPRQPAPLPPGVDWDLWLGPVAARPFTTGTIRMGWHPFSDICNGLIGNWGTHHISGGLVGPGPGGAEHDRSRRADRVAGEGVVSAGLCLEVHVPRPRCPRRKWPCTSTAARRPPRCPAPSTSKPGRTLHAGHGRAQGAGDRRHRGEHHGRPVVRRCPDHPREEDAGGRQAPLDLEGYGDHLESWLKACREGTPTASNFDFAAAVTEVALLGSIALRHGKKLQWDAEKMCFPNEPEADKYLRVELRKGWDV